MLHETLSAERLSASARLPRLDADAQRLGNIAYAHNAPVEFACGDETLRFCWEHAAQAFTPQWQGQIEFGGARVWVALEYLGVAVALGSEAAQLLPRALRQLILLQAFAPAFDAIEVLTGKKIAVTDLEAQQPAPTQGARVYFCLRNVDTHLRSRGWLHGESARAVEHLIAAAGLAPSVTAAQDGARWDAARLPLRLELAAIRLACTDLARLEPGDCLLLNKPQPADGALKLRGCLGARGGAYLFGGHLLANQLKITEVNETMQREELPLEGINQPLERLDTVELTLTFDLGEQHFALGELKRLQPGHVVNLERPVDDSVVRVRIGGRLVGTGQLVAIGDQLGVRITEFNAGNA